MQTKRNLASFLLEIIQSYDFGFDGRITAVDLAFGTQRFSLLLAPLSERVSDIKYINAYIAEYRFSQLTVVTVIEFSVC